MSGGVPSREPSNWSEDVIPKPLLFDDFVVGGELSTHQANYGNKIAAARCAIFGTSHPEGAKGAGVAVALMMRSYLPLAGAHQATYMRAAARPADAAPARGNRAHAGVVRGQRDQARAPLGGNRCAGGRLKNGHGFMLFSLLPLP